MSSLSGQLLLAAPGLLDPNFRRTVVLICDHSDDGALGIVLNRPGDLLVAEAVPELGDELDPGEVVWVGGPVRTDGVVVLAEWEDGTTGLLGSGPEKDALRAVRARAYAGVSGWGPRQLDGELEREDWLVLPAEAGDLFTEEPDALWSTVLARQGGELALLARMPEDPSLN